MMQKRVLGPQVKKELDEQDMRSTYKEVLKNDQN